MVEPMTEPTAAAIHSGVKLMFSAAASAPTATRIAVEGIRIDRKARFSAVAKTTMIKGNQAWCCSIQAMKVCAMMSMTGPFSRL